MNLSSKTLNILFLSSLIFYGCKKESIIEKTFSSGKIEIEFTHSAGITPLVLNSNQYINEAGNHFEINELMYFISDLRLHFHNRLNKTITPPPPVHYVDIKTPSTLIWDVFDSIPLGVIDSISFTFGLTPLRNQSHTFVNSPESNMAWPEILGGGYHYMMMDGKWITPNQTEQCFNLHMGIGQLYTDTITYNTNSINGYIHNNFEVTLSTPRLSIIPNKTAKLRINMDILSWFSTPHTWDFNYWGGGIMQNQRALKTLKENGVDLFTTQVVTE